MLAYDNVKKIESRDLIVAAIKEHLPNTKVSMFELLGAGVGAVHYSKNLPIENLLIVEKDRKLYRAFDPATLSCDCMRINCDAYTFFNKHYTLFGNDYFNVINLDFCSWFYNNDKPNCTSEIICKMFASKALKDDGLLFLTFQVNGQNVDRYQARTGERVPCTEQEIGFAVAFCAAKHGYELKEKILINRYKAGSRRGQQMVNIAFKVKKL